MTIEKMHNEMKANLKAIQEISLFIKYKKTENLPMVEMRMKNYQDFFKYMNTCMLGKKEEITRLYKMSQVALKKMQQIA